MVDYNNLSTAAVLLIQCNNLRGFIHYGPPKMVKTPNDMYVLFFQDFVMADTAKHLLTTMLADPEWTDLAKVAKLAYKEYDFIKMAKTALESIEKGDAVALHRAARDQDDEDMDDMDDDDWDIDDEPSKREEPTDEAVDDVVDPSDMVDPRVNFPELRPGQIPDTLKKRDTWGELRRIVRDFKKARIMPNDKKR